MAERSPIVSLERSSPDRIRHRPSRPQRGLLREYIEVLILSILLAVFARTFLVQAFEIPSGSMEPNLMVGDHLLVNKMIFGPAPTALERWLLPQRKVRRGDVVVFRHPEEPTRDLVKRCVATGGDEVRITDKTLWINQRPIEESYAAYLDRNVYPESRFLRDELRHRDNFGPFRVPDEHLFCLGDNRDFSHDSRFWGTVPVTRVRGRALMVYWWTPPEPANELSAVATTGLAESSPRAGTSAPSSPVRPSRWRRVFHLVR